MYKKAVSPLFFWLLKSVLLVFFWNEWKNSENLQNSYISLYFLIYCGVWLLVFSFFFFLISGLESVIISFSSVTTVLKWNRVSYFESGFTAVLCSVLSPELEGWCQNSYWSSECVLLKDSIDNRSPLAFLLSDGIFYKWTFFFVLQAGLSNLLPKPGYNKEQIQQILYCC